VALSEAESAPADGGGGESDSSEGEEGAAFGTQLPYFGATQLPPPAVERDQLRGRTRGMIGALAALPEEPSACAVMGGGERRQEPTLAPSVTAFVRQFRRIHGAAAVAPVTSRRRRGAGDAASGAAREVGGA
jgi:hypothetical protein